MLLGLMTLAMVSAVASANGQTQNLKADIPFEFVVGDQSLPAGSYTVRAIADASDALRIRGVEAKASAVRLTTAVQGKASNAKLVFHRYGQRYFLAEVWSTTNDGRELMASRQERAIQKELSRIASSKPAQRAYETVEIAIALQ